MSIRSHNPTRRRTGPHPAFLVFAGWLIPGSGMFFLGRRYFKRALLFFVVVHLTFFLGMCLKGGVIWPAWSFKDPGFNVVNNLNFIMQIGSGWLAILSWTALPLGWTHIAVAESHPFSELGGFYCLVAGAVNYFIIWESIDRSKKKAFEILAKQ